MKQLITLSGIAAALFAAFPATAQQPPDAGRVLNELEEPALELPKPSPDISFDTPDTRPAAGGPKVDLERVTFTGNQLFSDEVLQAALGDVTGKSYDLAGLDALARRVTAYYRRAGYPFARAYLLQQRMRDGQLQITVVEGRYGSVSTKGDTNFTARAQNFLATLAPGDIIEAPALERATLILNDQPGIAIVPIMRPGQEVGTGDLEVDTQRESRYGGEVGVDNFGSRATGRHRLGVQVGADSPFTLGDQLIFQGLYTDEDMWFGALAYSAPLGSSGLRYRVGYTHSYYALAGDFANLDASGTANAVRAGLSYPLVRSRLRNLTLTAAIEYKDLADRQSVTDTDSRKQSTIYPVGLQFDMRDQVLGGGITYGALTATWGDLRLDDQGRVLDQVTAQTEGRFHKTNFDIARIQSVANRVNLYARVSAQWAGKNLDSSEKFGLGGIHGVRAYPSGEGYGDAGLLAQLELRYTWNAYEPYAFYDAGRVEINQERFDDGENRRSIAGGGIGLRYTQEAWRSGVAVAWRTRGGAPLAETRDQHPVIWANMQYRF